MIITTRAIVISALKYSEADLIATCYTESSGVKTYLLRGILKSKKGKLRASLFQPLTQLEIVAKHKDKGTLESIREAKIFKPYQSLHTDVVKSSMVMFLSEMLKNAIKEEESNDRLFQYLTQSLDWLDDHNDIANFHILFLLELTTYLGFYPDTSDVDFQYFNLAEGYFETSPSGMYSEKGDVVENFKGFFGINFDAISDIKLTKSARLALLNLLLVYYQLHLQDYKKPKSLLVLNQLFN